MAKRKYYAVRRGKTIGVTESWDECRAATVGVSGAEFKSFSTRQEAEAYLRGEEPEERYDAAEEEWRELPPYRLLAYVDGSYDDALGRYSFSCVFLPPGGQLVTESGSGSNPESLPLRNVAGEMLGAMHAVQWAARNGYRELELRYDYAGIECWATGAWRAKNERTQQYAEYMQRMQSTVTIRFTKVPAHTGNKYNEMADSLAKEALRREGDETAGRGC